MLSAHSRHTRPHRHRAFPALAEQGVRGVDQKSATFYSAVGQRHPRPPGWARHGASLAALDLGHTRIQKDRAAPCTFTHSPPAAAITRVLRRRDPRPVLPRHGLRRSRGRSRVVRTGQCGLARALAHARAGVRAAMRGLHRAALIGASSGWVSTIRASSGATRNGPPTRWWTRRAATRSGALVSIRHRTAYGSTATAERVAKTVRAMHHTVKRGAPRWTAL